MLNFVLNFFYNNGSNITLSKRLRVYANLIDNGPMLVPTTFNPRYAPEYNPV